jgi:hypothetical protein
MDDLHGYPPGTHQQHIDETIALMENDANAAVVIGHIYAYIEGYSDIDEYGPLGTSLDHYFDELTQPPGHFSQAYQSWLVRELARINDQLRHCEPRGYNLASGYLTFRDDEYGPVSTKSQDELLAESEEFGEAYQAWRIRDTIRRLLRGDAEADPVEAISDWESLLATLRHGDHEEQSEAAALLGPLDPNQVKPARLLELLDDEESLVRFWATAMLLKNTEQAAATEDRLVAGLQDESWPVRRLCAEVLNHINSRAAQEEVADLLADEADTTQKWPSKEQLETRSNK